MGYPYAHREVVFGVFRFQPWHYKEIGMATLQELTQAVEVGNRAEARRLTAALLEAQTAPEQILDAMIVAMDEIGRRFQCNEIFVPEMLITARAMSEAMGLLEPQLVAAGIKPKYIAVIGTVQGDLHDIGKNLVAMMWKGAGFRLIDLGTNVSPEQFVAAAREHQPHIIGLSALLTTTMPAIQTTITALKQADLTHSKIIIGGAPITQAYADRVGADAYAADASRAVEKVKQMLAD